MIDQSHNVEGKIDAMIQSVMNIQTAYAKALLGRRRAPGSSAAGAATCSAPTASFWRPSRRTSGRCSRASARASGVEADPVEAFRAGGYAERLAKERGTGGVESAYERT